MRAWIRTVGFCAAVTVPLAADNRYLAHNLVSDLPGLADHVDANLVDPWGNAFSPDGAFWLGNNQTGTSTLYDGAGNVIPLVVNLPSPGNPAGGGAATGVIYNATQAFAPAGGAAPTFIFCTEDGTISGWSAGTSAQMLVDNSAAQAVYKGCAIGGTASGPRLYATNFRLGRIDVWDADLRPVELSWYAFADPVAPAGFAPFNIMNLNGTLYVTYAKQNAARHDDVAGVGNGFVAVFDMNGGELTGPFISGAPLNSPWGMALAPETFGDFAGTLLVGNFGDGLVHAFDASTGAFRGTLNDSGGKPIALLGLWSLLFGNGAGGGDPQTLYFAAGIPGPNGGALESHGLFGSVQAAPSFQANRVVNAASHSNRIGPNTFASIQGGGLSATTRAWTKADLVNNALPTKLDNVAVTLNGEPAYVSSISPMEITFLVPSDMTAGPVEVQTSNGGLMSASVMVTLEALAPAFYLLGDTKYLSAEHSDDASLVGPPNLISGATTRPARPGETIVLYGTGFGVTDPPAPKGKLVTSALKLVTPPVITIGGQAAQVLFAGLSEAGRYQFNVIVPSGLRAGDAAVLAWLPGVQSQPNAFLSIAEK